MGDRLSIHRGRSGTYRSCTVEFMGRQVRFPEGPMVLASLLGCPVVLMFARRERDGLKIYAEDFADQVVLRRGRRREDLQHYLECYAALLEKYALTHPLDWLNFYDFFCTPS